MPTPNYGWDHISSNQASKEVTANGVFDAIDDQVKTNADAAEQVSRKNAPNGYCPLDSDGLVPNDNLPGGMGGGGGGSGDAVQLVTWARADVLGGSANLYDMHGSTSGRWGAQNSTNTKVDATATERVKVDFASPSSAVAATYGNNNASGRQFTLGRLTSLKVRLRLTGTGNRRVWIGLSDADFGGSGTSPIKADAPALNLVGFRYSTNASDTKWMCVTQTDDTHQTATAESTSSHVDTSFHVFEISWDGSNVIFKIDGTQVGSQSANAPATSVKLDLVLAIDEVGSGVAKSFEFDYARIVEAS